MISMLPACRRAGFSSYSASPRRICAPLLRICQHDTGYVGLQINPALAPPRAAIPRSGVRRRVLRGRAGFPRSHTSRPPLPKAVCKLCLWIQSLRLSRALSNMETEKVLRSHIDEGHMGENISAYETLDMLPLEWSLNHRCFKGEIVRKQELNNVLIARNIGR